MVQIFPTGCEIETMIATVLAQSNDTEFIEVLIAIITKNDWNIRAPLLHNCLGHERAWD